MFKVRFPILFSLSCFFFLSCHHPERMAPDRGLMSSMGTKFREAFQQQSQLAKAKFQSDPHNLQGLLDHAEMQIMLYIFGLEARAETIPIAKDAFEQAYALDSSAAAVKTMDGILQFLDWNWEGARSAFQTAIRKNPKDPKARHWYALLLCVVTGSYQEAFLQSDTIMALRPSGEYQVGRGSLMYFARHNEELKALMLETVTQDPTVPWGYDWLGMAYVELGDFTNALETYHTAFELSDGLVEVGGGLGHALGLAGAHDAAISMAKFYSKAAEQHYLPPVQRAFIHIGYGAYEEAIELLEQAVQEQSWFIIFLKIEPWYDPLRNETRFQRLIEKMNFPMEPW